MDAGKVGQLPEALWDALLAARAPSPLAGAATPDDNAALPAKSTPPPITPGVKVDLRAATPSAAPVLPAGGYTVNLSSAAVTASRTPAPLARVALPLVEEQPKGEAKPRSEAAPSAREQPERPAARSEQAPVTGARPEVSRALIPASILTAAASNTSIRPELAARPGLEPAPQGVPVAIGLPTTSLTPSAIAEGSRVMPGASPATAEAPAGTQAQATNAATAPPAPRPYLDRVELSTDNGLLVASTVAPRPQAAPEAPSAPLAMPAPPGPGTRMDAPPAYMPAGAYAAGAQLAVAAEEAKAASRLSVRPTPELVQQLLIPHDAPRPPAPELYRLVIAAVVLGILLYLVL